MRVNSSADWEPVFTVLLAQMHSAPASCRKDLAKMLGNITELAQNLSRMEVDMRRNKQATTPRHKETCAKIEEAIEQFEQWLTLAYLGHG